MPSFLVVDDDPLMRRALSSMLEQCGTCQTAVSASDAELQIVSGGRWDGLLVDISLEDGCGLDVLSSARKTHPTAPALVVTGYLEPGSVNRAATLDARLVCKPFSPGTLGPFVRDVIAYRVRCRVGAARELARLRWQLSPRETEILDAVLRGSSRDDYLRASGISVNTFKTHVRHLLQKADYENLSTLAIDLLIQS